jgi:nucleoside 2-deoxyribosyltransferase
MTDMNLRVFISFARADSELVAQLSEAIEKQGGDVFSNADLAAGENWFDRIQGEIQGSDLIVFVVPAREGEGQSALFEIGAAKALGKPILAIVPDRTRSANTEVAVHLADTMLMDAARRSPDEIAERVIAFATNTASESSMGAN